MTVKMTARRPRRTASDVAGSLLDPIDILGEAIFALLIVLTFTLAYAIFLPDDYAWGAGYAQRLFLAALGATTAWGIIDGILYVLLSVFERGEKGRLVKSLRSAETEADALDAIADEFDSILEPITGEEKRRALYLDMLEHLKDSQPRPVRLTRDDLVGGLSSVLVAIIAVAPALLPLLIFAYDPELAIRISNIVAFISLFMAGYWWGRYTGSNPVRTGALLAAIGAVMVLIAIPLGG